VENKQHLFFSLLPTIKQYKGTKINNYYFQPIIDSVNFGFGHDKKVGLHLDPDLKTGSTAKCDTFNNTPLTETLFKIKHIEVYGFNE